MANPIPYQFRDFYGYNNAAAAPTLGTFSISNIQWNNYDLTCAITSNGGSNVTAHGFVVSETNTNPTIGGTGVTQYADTSISQSSFTHTTSKPATDDAATTYYVRAYATNSTGTTYTSAQTVTTLRRPITVKYVFTKFGNTSVCTTSATMTIYNETGNQSGTMFQLGDDIFVSADPTDNDQDFGALAHWFSDGNWYRRWGQTSWTSSNASCS